MSSSLQPVCKAALWFLKPISECVWLAWKESRNCSIFLFFKKTFTESSYRCYQAPDAAVMKNSLGAFRCVPSTHTHRHTEGWEERERLKTSKWKQGIKKKTNSDSKSTFWTFCLICHTRWLIERWVVWTLGCQFLGAIWKLVPGNKKARVGGQEGGDNGKGWWTLP